MTTNKQAKTPEKTPEKVPEKEAPVVAKIVKWEADFVVLTKNGAFELRSQKGPIFSSSGAVFVNGKSQTIIEWGADCIRGKFDSSVKQGDEVVVPIDVKIRRVGRV